MSAYGISLTRASFIPRPFPLPVFDHLQYANTERGKPGRFGHMQLHEVDEGRHTGGGA